VGTGLAIPSNNHEPSTFFTFPPLPAIKRGYARLSVDSHIGVVLSLRETRFKGPALFNFAEIRSIQLAPSGTVAGEKQFQDQIDLTGCVYDRIEGDRNSLLSAMRQMVAFNKQPYLQLESAYQSAAKSEDADAVYLERKRIERTFKHGVIDCVIDWLYKVVLNYGVRDFRIPIVTICVLTWVAWFFRRHGAIKQSEHSGNRTKDHQPSVWDAILVAFGYFLPVNTTLGSHWEVCKSPITYTKRKWVPKRLRSFRPSSVAAFAKIMGWLAIPLFAALVAGLMRK
jgi:hypothetical protein